MIKALLLFILLSIVSCGADDESESQNEASTDLKPSLWDQEQLDYAISDCMSYMPEYTTLSSSLYCGCYLEPIAQKYEYEIVEANSVEIFEREMPLLEECAKKYL